MMIIIIYVALFALMGATARTKYYPITKTLSSLGFLGTALYGAITCQHMNLFYLMLPGLIGFAVGDFLLAMRQDKLLLYGIIAFAIGDAGFLFFFSQFHGITPMELIPPVVVMIIMSVIAQRDDMDFKNLIKPLFAYAFIMSWATSKAIMLAFLFPTTMFLLLAIGFGLYFISDLVLLFVKFSMHRFHIMGGINLVLYYTGLFLIAYSLFFA